MSPFWRGAVRVCLLFTLSCSQSPENPSLPDLGVPNDLLHPVPKECLSGVPCIEDRDCLGAPGTRCNTALIEPECQTIRCGAENSLCSEDALCPADMRCWSGRCGTCLEVPLGGLCVDGQGSCVEESFSVCNNECVDTSMDPRHCGGCDRPIPPQSACRDGTESCADGLSACGGECVLLEADSLNCGGCGKSCEYLQDLACGSVDCYPQVLACGAGQCEMPVVGGPGQSCDEICPIVQGRCARGIREDMSEVPCDDQRADICFCGFDAR